MIIKDKIAGKEWLLLEYVEVLGADAMVKNFISRHQTEIHRSKSVSNFSFKL